MFQMIHIENYDYSKRSIKLETLPKNVFAGILNQLSAMDVFRLTLVSKAWKARVQESGRDLRKSKYNLGFYLMECPHWVENVPEVRISNRS